MREPSQRLAPAPEAGLLPIYIAAGTFFAALSTRGFLVPLRAHELGADRFTVGLLFTLVTLSGGLLSLPAGFLADRFGRRPVVVLSVIVGGITQIAIAASASIPFYMLWQILGGLGAGAAQAGLFAAVADAAPGHRMGRAMGWLTLAMQVGFLGGPALAGVLLQWLSLKTDLAVTTGLYLGALGTTVAFPRGTIHRHASWDVITPLRELAARRGFWAVVLALFAATLVWGTLQAYLPLFAKEVLLLPGVAIGYLLALQAVSNGLSRIPGGRIVDRVSQKGWIAAGGIIVFALSLLVLPHTRGFWLPALVLVVAVPFAATAFVAIGVSFSQLASAERRGIAMGLYGSVLFLGLAIGPALFGGLMTSRGYTAGFSACALTGIALSVLMLGIRSVERRGRPAVVLPPPTAGA